MKLFTVDKERFDTRKDACSYAKTASSMFSDRKFVVRYDGFAVETYKQGRRVSE